MNINFVTEDEAKNYALPPNTRVLLMDKTQPIFYVKTSDFMGNHTIARYSFKEVPFTQTENTPTPPTIESLRDEIIKIVDERLATRAPTTNPSHKEDTKHDTDEW